LTRIWVRGKGWGGHKKIPEPKEKLKKKTIFSDFSKKKHLSQEKN
jgi:hypothetical protein